MAGFLAPTIPDIGPAPRAPVAPADTSIGDAFSGVASIVNLVGRSVGGTTTETQQDRDDRILRPTFDRFRALLAQRDSGDLTPAQFAARKSALISSSIAANPSQRSRIVDGLSVLAGEPVGVVEQTTEGILNDNRNVWLATPIGAASAVLAVSESLDAEGNLDARAFDLALNKVYNASLFEEAGAAQMQNEVEKAKLTLEYNNIKQDQFIDPLLSDQSIKAAAIIEAHLSVFMKDTSGTSDDAVIAVAGLEKIKSEWRSNFTVDAASRGILDESSYTTGLAVIMKQFDDQIAYLQRIADSEAAQLTIRENRQTAAVIRILNEGGLLADEPTRQAFSIINLENNLVNVEQIALAMRKFAISSAPLAPTASDPGTVSVYTDAFSVEAANLSEELQIMDVTTGIEYWKGGQSFKDEDIKNEDQRGMLVTNLGRALGVLNTTGDPISESTFDKVYDPAFVNQYKRITKFNDETARILENVVRTNLGTTLDKRREFTKTNIRNRLGDNFPGVTMKFDGEKFVIDYGTGRGTTLPQRRLFDVLDRNGLPRTSEGIKTLLSGTQQLDKDELRAVQVVQGVASDEIDYLNKIVGTINLFPEFSETALPSATEFGEEGVRVSPIRVRNESDVSKLEFGEAWEFTDEDGNVHNGMVE